MSHRPPTPPPIAADDASATRRSPRRLRVALACALLALVAGSACGEATDTSPRDRWVGEGEDPMEVPETYERNAPPDSDDRDGPVSLHDPNRPDEQRELVLQPNVYVLKPNVADRATIENGEVVLPLERAPYLARRKAGDIVISPNRTFAWRRIVEVEFDGSTVRWKTEHPELDDVIKDGYFYIDADLTHPEGLPTVDLAAPYASGPLEMFHHRADGQMRQRRQAASNGDLSCDMPPECEMMTVDCGDQHCPCSADACSNAAQCGGDGGQKSCELDPCQIDGAGSPSRSHPGTCQVILEGPGQTSTRCVKPCDDDEDCGEETWCKSLETLDEDDGVCTNACSAEDGNDIAAGSSIIDKLLDKLVGNLAGFEGLGAIPHGYFDIEANFRSALDVDWLPPGLTISAVVEADFLAGLGMLFEFTSESTWTLPADPPAEVEIGIPPTEGTPTFTILGWPFKIKLLLHGYLEFETTLDGKLKIDYKVYSTRLATPEECDPDSGDGCEAKLPWKDHSAEWSNYETDHSGGEYGGPPDTESEDDAVIGTYAQEAESDPAYGVAYGGSIGSDLNCLGYDKYCSKAGLLGFGGALISKNVTTSLFGVDVDTSIENYLTGEAGAQVGLYTNTGCLGAYCSRILYVEPVNFFASAFATFDPPFCGFGFDLFYRVFFGLGPIDLFGLLTLETPSLPLFSPIAIFSDAWRATPACYVPAGADEAIPVDQIEDWDQDWEDDRFWCRVFRSLAELDSDLACGAKADVGEPTAGPGCPCGDGQTCMGDVVCVDDPEGSLRISMIGGVQTDDRGLYLSVTPPSGDEVVPDPIDPEEQSNYQTMVTTTFESPASGVYKIRIANESGDSLPDGNVPYILEIDDGDGQVQRIDGTISGGEHQAPFVFRHRE